MPTMGCDFEEEVVARNEHIFIEFPIDFGLPFKMVLRVPMCIFDNHAP